MKYYLYLSLSLAMIACSEGNQATSEVEYELPVLSTLIDQIAFLDSIYDIDQGVRTTNTPSGQIRRADSTNLEAIRQYLATYGYPDIKKHGDSICQVPWMVVHHSPYDMDARGEFFPIIYRAYEEGNISGDDLAFYLNRAVSMSIDERVIWGRPFTTEEEIDTALAILEWRHMIEK